MPIPSYDDFFQQIQNRAEQYYLQPFDPKKPKKLELRDGKIERQVHGAMHASRATIWTLLMHEVLRKLVPDYANNAIQTIAKHVKMDEASVIRLILLTIFVHDSAREGEGVDKWDKQSGENCNTLLQSYGLDEDSANIFSKVIEFKDNPTEYDTVLKAIGIEARDIPAFRYIRTLVNLGDNLDIVRTREDFNTKFVYNTLSGVPGFDATVHGSKIDAILMSVQRFVHEQYDMRLNNRIVKEKIVLSEKPANYSDAEKLTFEHAPNVFLMTYVAVLGDKEFNKDLSEVNYFKQALCRSKAEEDEPDLKYRADLETAVKKERTESLTLPVQTVQRTPEKGDSASRGLFEKIGDAILAFFRWVAGLFGWQPKNKESNAVSNVTAATPGMTSTTARPEGPSAVLNQALPRSQNGLNEPSVTPQPEGMQPRLK
ncbi:MAG: hypothetical protein V4490_06650 [Pseudomonadota bacterium]